VFFGSKAQQEGLENGSNKGQKRSKETFNGSVTARLNWRWAFVFNKDVIGGWGRNRVIGSSGDLKTKISAISVIKW
jgi:hypothetical protein